jgi:AraC-like DNA-binding protein
MEKAVLFKTNKLDDLLVFKARFHRFQFTRHSHEDFALGLIEEGIQCFSSQGKSHTAPQGSMITVNPDEIHDGQSADNRPYGYRLLYIPASLILEIGTASGAAKTLPYFLAPVTHDRELAHRLTRLFTLLEDPSTNTLEACSLFYSLVVDLFSRHGTGRENQTVPRQLPMAIKKVRAYILDMAKEEISLDDMAEVAGLSRYHFLRTFTTSLGISPHAYLLNRRLQLAKTALKNGSTISDAALEAGFFDQSHLTRRFKAAFGLTPRQFQKAACQFTS